MNYTTSIAYNTRNGDFEQPEGFKFMTIKETYIKVLAVIISLSCAAGVLFLNSL